MAAKKKAIEGKLVYGEKLRMLRNKSGLTQEDVGDLVGLTRQQISHYERGRNSMRAELFDEIIHKLEARVQTLDVSQNESLYGGLKEDSDSNQEIPSPKDEAIKLLRTGMQNLSMSLKLIEAL